MKFRIEDIQLSGKGFISSQEYSHENIKMMLDGTQFYEVVVAEGEESRRLGWLVTNSFTLLGDFIAHTKNGARGESTEDVVEAALLFDYQSYLTELVPETLMDLDTAEAQELLTNMFSDSEGMMKGKIDLDDFTDNEKGLLIISPRSNLVFVQTEDASIRVSKAGVFVLKRGDPYDKLVTVDSDRGVNVFSDKSITVGPGGIVIDGKDFNIDEIMQGVGKSIEASLGSLKGLGPMMAGISSGLGSMGGQSFSFGADITGKINRKIKKAMKNFGNMNFGNLNHNFNFNFDFDDDDDFGFDTDDFESDMHDWASGVRDMVDTIRDEVEDAMNDLKDEFKGFGSTFGSYKKKDVDRDFSDAHDVDVDF